MVPPPAAISPVPFAADNDVAAAAATAASAASAAAGMPVPGVTRVDPGQRQVLDGGLIDLGERAVAPAGIVAVVGGPRILQRLEQFGREHSACPVPARMAGASSKRRGEQQLSECHFKVTR